MDQEGPQGDNKEANTVVTPKGENPIGSTEHRPTFGDWMHHGPDAGIGLPGEDLGVHNGYHPQPGESRRVGPLTPYRVTERALVLACKRKASWASPVEWSEWED